MSKSEGENQRHCGLMGGTTNYFCTFQGPYKYSRNKPSKAIEAAVRKIPFLQCRPALELFIKHQDGELSEEEREENYRQMCKTQSNCSKYNTTQFLGKDSNHPTNMKNLNTLV